MWKFGGIGGRELIGMVIMLARVGMLIHLDHMSYNPLGGVKVIISNNIGRHACHPSSENLS